MKHEGSGSVPSGRHRDATDESLRVAALQGRGIHFAFIGVVDSAVQILRQNVL